jgi:hypothetical protein
MALIAALSVMMVGCGKKGPPQAPIRILPSPPGPLSVRQIGPDIVVATTLPGTRTDGTRLEAGAEVRVLRMAATESLRPGAVSERYLVQQFERQARPVGAFSGADLDALVLAGRFLFVDRGAGVPAAAAPAAGPAPETHRSSSTPRARPVGYLYGIQVVEHAGKKSALRPPLLIESCDPPPVPGEGQVDLGEGEVRLRWSAGESRASPPSGPAPPVAKSTSPAAESQAAPGFNVYRRQPGAPRDPETPLNPETLDGTSYIDRTFQYDIGYEYFVRSVVPGRTPACESPDGAIVAVKPHDRFPPAAPTGLAVAAEGGTIRVYWFPNDEPDLAGYRIYRSEEGKPEMGLIAEVPATETSFVDSGAQPGVRYHYAVTAVDGASPPNESARSEERSEMLTPPPPAAP